MTLICFDLDDTLVKSYRAHVAAFNKAFANHNLSKVKSDRIRFYFGLAGNLLVKKLFPKLDSRTSGLLADEHTKLLFKCYLPKVEKIKGASRMLSTLRKRGYKLALISNSRKRIMIPLLKAGGLQPKMFNVIIGRDEVKHPKPWPDEILAAMKKLNATKVYMIGDTFYDIKAGKLAKAKTVAVLTGFQKRSLLKEYKPDYILKDVSELVKVLK